MTTAVEEKLTWNVEWRVQKYGPDDVARMMALLDREPLGADFEAAGIAPVEDLVFERNLLTTAGLARISSLILGAGGQAATATAARLGIGDGTGPAAIGDTDLSAAAGGTHRQFVIMDATFPSFVNGVMTFQATFTTGLANFVWNEFGIDVGAPVVANGTAVSATLLNHKIQSAGTKVAGAVWVASATITLV